MLHYESFLNLLNFLHSDFNSFDFFGVFGVNQLFSVFRFFALHNNSFAFPIDVAQGVLLKILQNSTVETPSDPRKMGSVKF